jgi:hypothetical protein
MLTESPNQCLPHSHWFNCVVQRQASIPFVLFGLDLASSV